MTRSLPDPDECLTRLQASGATVERVSDVRGVEVPIILRGPVAGIEYWASDGRPLLLDCRLGFALVEIAPILERHGVSRVRFSGAYVYRTTRSGRLSHHAHGLAIDVHDITVQAESLTVKEHFARGAGCEGDLPVLNRIACDLGQVGLFQELLTPDYNRDHHDHFHLAVPRPEDLSRGEERSARRAGAP